MAKLTRWFAGSVRPVRAGVYEVSDLNETNRVFAHWNGKRFGYRCWAYGERDEQRAINDAFELRFTETCLPPHGRWRGLSKEPK